MQLNSGVYKIVNVQTGDFYIGSSINLSLREKNHFNKLKHNKHVNTYLQNVYAKYGKENLKFEILATCPKEYLLKLEQCFINNLNPKYNFLKIAGSSLGYKHSKKTLEIMKSKYNRNVLTKLQDGNKKYFEKRNSKYKQVASLLKEGRTQKEICLLMNMTNQQFWLLKNQAITKGALEKQPSKKDLFLSMYKQGKSRIEIIQELNLTSVGYRNYKHKYIKDGL